ncbi:MAG TPA: GNAT family N-acetyltransferase [Thermoleophilaceae bacterium]
MTTAPVDATFREGGKADLEATFALSERAIYDAAVKRGVLPPGRQPTAGQTRASWRRHKGLIEFLAGQPDTRYRICERGGEPVAYARVVQFGEMEELTELMVEPRHQGQGIGRALLEQVWPGDPTPELGRVVVATGEPTDLGLYMEFGVMPVCGHWHIRQRTDRYLANRSQEIERVETAVHVLKADRAVSEWSRLEPPVVGHERPALHEFLCRDRTCLATIDPDTHETTSLCWVSSEGEIGPAVATQPSNLVPVVLAALDRVAATVGPEYLSLFSTTIAWWLLKRMRGLGFEIWWPSWIMCSVPLPELNRYVPTRPPQLL